MLKTISPIDNSIYVERPYASSSEIENTLKLSEKSKLIWKNTSLDERKKLVSKFVECFLSNNKEIEDFVLNDRIDGAKNFKVNATPTIIINNEKFDKTLNYKNLKKALEKLI